MKAIAAILLSCLLLVGCNIVGCNKENKRTPPPTNPTVTEPIKEMKSATATIKEEAKAAEKIAPEVKPHTDVIQEKAGTIGAATLQVEKAAAEKDKIIKDQVKTIEKLNKELQDEKDSYLRLYKRYSVIVGSIAFLCLAASIVALALGYLRTAVPIIISGSIFAGAVTLGWLLQYFWLIAIGTILVLVGSVAYIIYRKHQQGKELVQTGEEMKKQIPDAAWLELEKLLNQVQSNDTMQFVKKVRSKINGTFSADA